MVIAPDTQEADWLWTQAQPHYAVSWFWSHAEAPALATRLASWLDARSDDGMEFMVRYYDPRLAHPVLALMGEEALAGLVLPDEVWGWLDPWGKACVVQGSRVHEQAARTTVHESVREMENKVGNAVVYAAANETANRQKNRVQPIPGQGACFSEAQTAALMLLCEPGALLQQLQQRVPQLLRRWSPSPPLSR